MNYSSDEAKYLLDINIPADETTAAVKKKALTKADILKAYKLGQIDDAEAMSRLISIGYSTDDAIFLIDLTIATAIAITEPTQKNLTKADIVKGVKSGIITAEEGYMMLIDISYTSDEANFILAISPTTTGGSWTNSENEVCLI